MLHAFHARKKQKPNFFNSIENYGRSLLIKVYNENKTHPNKKADPTLSAAIILAQPSTTP